MDKVFKRISNLVDSYKQDVIDMQRSLVSRPALGPENNGDGEYEKVEYIKQLLKELGVDEIKEIHAPDKRVSAGYRPNILARVAGRDRGKTIWIMAHTDVVPAGDLKLWNSDPFQLYVDGDKLIGRGVEDNHQGLVSALLAIKALKEAGVRPKYDIGLAIVADEETGSKYGLQYLMEKHQQEFKKEDLIIVPDAGDEKGRLIEVAEKSILWIKFHTVGKQCHASTPQLGINAHRAAANLIVKLDELNNIFSAVDPVYDPPQSTFEPTKKETNVMNVNTIPGDDVFYLDCRVLPQYSLQEVEDKIKEMIGEIEKEYNVKIDISYPQKNEAAPPTPEDAPVVVALAKAIQDVKGEKAKVIGIGGGTVAAFFREAGYPAAVWATIEDTAHQPNEYSLISNTLSDAKVFAHVFLQ